MALRNRLSGSDGHLSDAVVNSSNYDAYHSGSGGGGSGRSYFTMKVPSRQANSTVSRAACVPAQGSFAHAHVETDPLANGTSGGSGADHGVRTSFAGLDVKRGHLTVIPLIGVIFANCVGSGYGFEQAVGGAGPLVTLIVCNILPWFWSLPTGLAVAELSSAMPSNSGSIVWINAMYHPIISFANILLSIAVSCLCNASYASLTSQYVLGFIEPSIATPEEWKKDIFKVVAVVLCAGINITGVEIVGVATVISTLITLSPFVGIIIGSFIKYPVNWHALASVPSDINWPQFISIITWNYSNIDSVGNIVEEVSNPKKTLVRAMVPVMCLTYVAYFLPVMAGVSAAAAQPGYNNGWWVEGYWGDVAGYVGGKGLRDFLLFGAIVSGLGYLITGLCYAGRQLAGMGEMDAFPDKVSTFLAELNARFGTPVRGLVLHGIVAIILSLSLSFNNLVALNQVLYCVRLSLVYVAAVKLRYQHPTLSRPFSFPAKNTWSFAACMFIAFAVSVATAILSAMQSTVVIAVSIGFIAGALLASAVYVHYIRPTGFLGCVVYDTTHNREDDSVSGLTAPEAAVRCVDDESLYH